METVFLYKNHIKIGRRFLPLYSEKQRKIKKLILRKDGQALEYGIRSEDGTAYFQEKQGGSSLLLIEEIPAGTYRLYVKNPETFNALSENESAESVNVTGALVYSRVPR